MSFIVYQSMYNSSLGDELKVYSI